MMRDIIEELEEHWINHRHPPACIVHKLENDPRQIQYIHPNQKKTSPNLTTDGVYTADGSPPIGTYKFTKPMITYALVLQQGQTFVDIPNTHNLFVAVNEAYTTWEINCGLKFTAVPVSANPDVTISINSSDPMFTPPSGMKISPTMGYTYYPNLAPAGKFVCVLNAAYFWSLDGKFNFSYNINNTLRHELGHSIGCVHTTGPLDIMYPFYNTQIRQQPEDILQVNTMYGPRTPPLNPVEIEAFYAGDAKLIEFS